ncbi:hypothetical protein J437_LFUL015410 [Ladona fulva]|uniref:PiggyBac transposable element-derived protein domain-containing protein n=1 Tax=Ladona fulva TaxID=123851 RepID=A0A8K0P7J0_LADFU|nr:hypothetical protein J437_LFUL015410 [Ladona fulva]
MGMPYIHGTPILCPFAMGNPELKVEMEEKDNILKCYKLFVDDKLCSMISEQMNIYAKQFLDANPDLKPRSRARSWIETTSDEIRVLLGKGHTLYLENWYTSPRLVDKLVKSNTDCVGTMSSNRKEFPQTVKSAKLKKGEITAAFRGKQMVMKWKDKRDVIIVSTFHGTEMCEVEKKRRKNC